MTLATAWAFAQRSLREIAPNLTGTTKIVRNRQSLAKSATVSSWVMGVPKPPTASTTTKSLLSNNLEKLCQTRAKSISLPSRSAAIGGAKGVVNSKGVTISTSALSYPHYKLIVKNLPLSAPHTPHPRAQALRPYLNGVTFGLPEGQRYAKRCKI